MTTLTWTKDFTSADDGNTIGGADIGNIQDDFKGVINGNLDNANVNASAAVEEYKIRYDLDDGHDHDGVNSRLLPTSGIALPHARSGCAVKRASVSTLTVEPGAINIGGTVFVIETATTLDMTSDFASGSEGSDAWFYIYAKASGTSLAFVLSTSPPSFSDTSSNTTEIPFRYDVYASIDHRLIGAGFNDSSSDIVIDTVHSFDLSPMIMGKVTGGATAADDFTVETGWTPKFINVMAKNADDSMTDGDSFSGYWADHRLVNTDSLILEMITTNHKWIGTGSANEGLINAITDQTTSAMGSFTMDLAGTAAGAREFHYIVWGDAV